MTLTISKKVKGHVHRFLRFVFSAASYLLLSKTEGHRDHSFHSKPRHIHHHLSNLGATLFCDVTRVFFRRFKQPYLHFTHVNFVCEDFGGDSFTQFELLSDFCKFIKYVFAIWLSVFFDFVLWVIVVGHKITYDVGSVSEFGDTCLNDRRILPK